MTYRWQRTDSRRVSLIMDGHGFSTVVVLLSLLLLQAQMLFGNDASQVHIVYMGKKAHKDPSLTTKMHHETLAAAMGSRAAAKNAMLYSYKHGFSGFAANLNSAQARIISKMSGVISVFPSQTVELHTTHSWEFLGLDATAPHGLWKEANFGADMIIGVVDTGIWPEAESFRDDSLPPVPKRWKGICQTGQKFNSSSCNRKLIGARWYNKGFKAITKHLDPSIIGFDYKSARDINGHGTHVASTAAGRPVEGASVQGFGSGVATGGAPLARIAMYKAVWTGVSTEADVASAIDDAIHDGVDILSISLGDPRVKTHEALYLGQGLALAAFHAVEKGVLVVCAGGNSGPRLGTVANAAPWILTVAASTIDRGFYADLKLGNNATYKATSLSRGFEPAWYPIVSGEDVSLNASTLGVCYDGPLDVAQVTGNYVLCRGNGRSDTSVQAAIAVLNAGGVGVVLELDPPRTAISQQKLLPLFYVSPNFANELANYILLAESPAIHVNPSRTVIGKDPAPVLASFSSRGPSLTSPDILKPDITAPGVNIIAAVPPTNHSLSPGSRSFQFYSGTSMACPHVSGVAALLKSLHPDWSPSAIKSAIMTTASSVDNTVDVIRDMATEEPSNPFGYGAGNIDPSRAADPGLVYDISPQDYALFYCILGFNSDDISSEFVNKSFACPSQRPTATVLNYPSIAISNLVETQTVERVVTNVGAANSTYHVRVEEPHGVKVVVSPEILKFDGSVKQLSYDITFTPAISKIHRYVFGSIVWSDGVHSVRSPIAIQVNSG